MKLNILLIVIVLVVCANCARLGFKDDVAQERAREVAQEVICGLTVQDCGTDRCRDFIEGVRILCSAYEGVLSHEEIEVVPQGQ